LLLYTCTRNDGEKYAQQYIDESKYVTLHIPKGKMDVDYGPESIMTGVLMNSTERIRTDSKQVQHRTAIPSAGVA